MKKLLLTFSFILTLFSLIILNSCQPDELPTPSIESFTPEKEGVGSEVQIKGKNFGSTITFETILTFNGVQAVITSLHDSLIVANVPEGATTGKISLSVDGKTSISKDDFEVLKGRWVKKKGMPVKWRGYPVAFSIGNKGYWGMGIDGATFKDFYEYDPDLDEWTQKADIPVSRYFCTSFVINGKAYVGLGHENKGDKNEDLADFYQYDPLTDEWTKKADFPGQARSNAVGFSIGDRGYVGVGRNYSSTLNDFWEYNPDKDEWTQKADYPGNSYNNIGLTQGSKGFVGVSGLGYNDWWQYDPIENSWTRKAQYIGADAYAFLSFTTNEKIFAIGLRSCWEYDPSTDQWTQRASSLEKTEGDVGFSIGNRGYITTGSFTAPPQHLYEFEID